MRPLPQESTEAAIWQDVEFGSYAADLPLWLELSERADGPVLELGAGAGRVTVHLAERGVEVMALEREPELVAELERRAEGLETPFQVVQADLAKVAEIRLPAEPSLVIAPLQVLQALEPTERLAMLGAMRELLPPGAILAVALVDEATMLSAGAAASQILPDMREVDDWVFSSEPLWVQVDEEKLTVRRVRERVSPEGGITRAVHDDRLHRVSPERLQLEAEDAGFTSAGTRAVQSSENEADSVVVLLEAA